ncbi:hypothetical protein NW767_014847 [Fusarium falciforme]|nr:hypothetical protein NW767_014847 [Fusarium falciforme]KAJ4223946.1 hypothetical protein NW757_014357 [Fusarium falciforme]
MSVVQNRAHLESELVSFIEAYELANNSHDISRVMPFIAEDATYWFSDGSYRGIAEIRAAIEKTFLKIVDEVYKVRDLEWPVVTTEVAVCRYRFAWTGIVGGEARSGLGRGTTIIVRRGTGWMMLHEHLSF